MRTSSELDKLPDSFAELLKKHKIDYDEFLEIKKGYLEGH